MRLKKTVMGLMAASALTVSLAATMSSGFAADGKPQPSSTPSGADSALLAKEAASAKHADSALQRDMLKIDARIRHYVQNHPGKHTFGSYVDATTNRLVIESDASSDLVARLAGPEGKAHKVVVHTAKIKDSYSRRDDIPSYWGGAGVTASVGSPWCSTGFTVQNGAGTRFQVTAGHCFSNGTNTYTELGGRWMGSVSNNGLSDYDKHDMELIGGSSYWGYIYTGGVDSSSGLPVVGAGDPVEGYNNYCHSGRTTGENCGHTDVSNFAQVCTQSGCKYPVVAWTGGNLIQGGDSGSPFYVKSSTSVWARGINIASGGGTAYSEKWSRIAGRYGVAITTG